MTSRTLRGSVNGSQLLFSHAIGAGKCYFHVYESERLPIEVVFT